MSSKLKNLEGMVVGRLTVGRRAYRSPKNRVAYWYVLCECGSRGVVAQPALTRKRKPTRSCGCYIAEAVRKANRKHGGFGTPEYAIWCGLIDRCYNPNAKNYERYGGRGIKMSRSWRRSFENFIRDMGQRPYSASPRGFSIERRDNNGNYTARNCYWATPKTQARNRRNNRLLTFDGETMPVAAWSERLGFKRSVIGNRLRSGWSVKQALLTPVKGSV